MLIELLHRRFRMDTKTWLREMFRKELDLRPPSLARIDDNTMIIYDDKNEPIACASLANRWTSFELTSVVIDPKYRGKGLSHKLLKKFDKECVLTFTRNVRLQSALVKAGFHRRNYPGHIPMLSIIINRIGLLIWMLISLDFKRLVNQIRNISKYKLYIKD